MGHGVSAETGPCFRILRIWIATVAGNHNVGREGHLFRFMGYQLGPTCVLTGLIDEIGPDNLKGRDWIQVPIDNDDDGRI